LPCDLSVEHIGEGCADEQKKSQSHKKPSAFPISMAITNGMIMITRRIVSLFGRFIFLKNSNLTVLLPDHIEKRRHLRADKVTAHQLPVSFYIEIPVHVWGVAGSTGKMTPSSTRLPSMTASRQVPIPRTVQVIRKKLLFLPSVPFSALPRLCPAPGL
jgi:hypothetical protein